MERSIQTISDIDERRSICNDILRALPDWFGIEDAIVDYIEGVREGHFIAVLDDERPIGFISLHETSPHANEIYVMGVLEKYHRNGFGKKMVEYSIQITRDEGKQFMIVKTLSSKHPDLGYSKTRTFYENVGFLPLEELTDLWGEANPCLNMVMHIEDFKN